MNLQDIFWFITSNIWINIDEIYKIENGSLYIFLSDYELLSLIINIQIKFKFQLEYIFILWINRNSFHFLSIMIFCKCKCKCKFKIIFKQKWNIKLISKHRSMMIMKLQMISFILCRIIRLIMSKLFFQFRVSYYILCLIIKDIHCCI